jgi:hypothetical protein
VRTGATARAIARIAALSIAGVLAWGCRSAPPAPPAPSGAGWLAAEPDRRTAQLERQLRGFDVAMLETGQRYAELYWAGEDRN